MLTRVIGEQASSIRKKGREDKQDQTPGSKGGQRDIGKKAARKTRDIQAD